MKLYTHRITAVPEPQPVNWRENSLSDALMYSFRSTRYTRANYPASLHYHDYYEIIVFVEGAVQYMRESALCQPQRGDVIIVPPQQLHMSAIQADETLYTRHVFYLYPDALSPFGCGALTDFLAPESPHLLTLPDAEREQLLSLLARLDAALTGDARAQALARGLVLEVFYLLGQAESGATRTGAALPEHVAAIRQYIDQHVTELRSVSDVAAHFFYSREYVSRLFRRYLHTTPASYMTQRRVAASQALIASGLSLADACYQAGFGSMSAFNRAFRAVTGMTPGSWQAK